MDTCDDCADGSTCSLDSALRCVQRDGTVGQPVKLILQNGDYTLANPGVFDGTMQASSVSIEASAGQDRVRLQDVHLKFLSSAKDISISGMIFAGTSVVFVDDTTEAPPST